MKVCCFACWACVRVCVFGPAYVRSVALTPAAKGGSGEIHPLCCALCREREIFSPSWGRETPSLRGFTAAFPSVISVWDLLEVPVLKFTQLLIWSFCSYFSFWLAPPLFVKLHLCLPFSMVACFLVLLNQLLKASMLIPPKSSTTSWKQQAVRMTSSCHKVFYVLTASSHSFHGFLCCCKSTQLVMWN